MLSYTKVPPVFNILQLSSIIVSIFSDNIQRSPGNVQLSLLKDSRSSDNVQFSFQDVPLSLNNVLLSFKDVLLGFSNDKLPLNNFTLIYINVCC